MLIRISDDALARALGADALAAAFAAKGHEVYRVSSWGMHWLEPLVEVTTSAGRVGYGPVEVDDIEMGTDTISFSVSKPGVPILVKTSYFPNWA